MNSYLLYLLTIFFIYNCYADEPLLQIPRLETDNPFEDHLSLEQVRHLANVHKTFAHHRHSQKATSDPLELWTTVNASDPELEINENPAEDTVEEIMRSKLAALPTHNRPANIDLALREIHKGKASLELVKKGKFFDAVSKKDPIYQSHREAAILRKAFNSTDDEFWQEIQDNAKLKEKASHHNIPFTVEALQNPEFNMYFRSTYARIHIADQALLHNFLHDYEQTIVELQWGLYAHSMMQDIAFTSGMITMQDSDHCLFKFLDGYAELVSPKYKLHNGKSFHALSTTKAYSRESSHWSGQKAFAGKNFGIDFFDQAHQPVAVLPGNKSHLLFGMRSNGMVFCKWEEYGVTFNPFKRDMSAVKHTMRYFEKRNLEDDTTLHRREKVPAVVLAEFHKLYKTPNKAAAKSIEVHGISEMCKLLRDKNPNDAEQFNIFLTHQMHYDPTTLHLRKGGEVILKV